MHHPHPGGGHVRRRPQPRQVYYNLPYPYRHHTYCTTQLVIQPGGVLVSVNADVTALDGQVPTSLAPAALVKAGYIDFFL